jgi:hypothetical protein
MGGRSRPGPPLGGSCTAWGVADGAVVADRQDGAAFVPYPSIRLIPHRARLVQPVSR